MSSRILQAVLRIVLPLLWLGAMVLAAFVYEPRGRLLLVQTGGNAMTKVGLIVFDMALVTFATVLIWAVTGAVDRGGSQVLVAGVGSALGTTVTVTSVLILRMHSVPAQVGPVSPQTLISIGGEILIAGTIGFFLGATLEGLRQQFLQRLI